MYHGILSVERATLPYVHVCVTYVEYSAGTHFQATALFN